MSLIVVRREATTSAASIRARCLKAAAQDFADTLPPRFLQSLYELAGLLKEEADQVFASAGLSDETKLRRVRWLHQRLRILSELVRYADSARVSNIPWSIVEPFKRLFTPLLKKCEILVRPKWHWNYEVLRGVGQYLVGKVLNLIEQTDSNRERIIALNKEIESWGPSFAIVSFPYTDRKNVLRHLLFAHEIGHLVTDIILPEYFLENESIVYPFLVKLASENVPEGIEPDEIGLFLSATIERAEKYIRRATEEILCDIAAVTIFGPSAILAAFEVAVVQKLSIPPSEQNNYYPPWRVRLSQMLQFADKSLSH